MGSSELLTGKLPAQPYDGDAGKEELPFYGEDDYETMTNAEQAEMYEAWDEHRENPCAGTKPSG